MARQIKAGTLNVSMVVRIVDSTDGTPELGVVTATTGLAFNYRREAAVAVAITTINDLALLTTAHTDGGILHIGDGYYRIDFQDAAFAAGTTGVLLTGTATGMVVVGEYVELIAYDTQDTVRLGLTALPNAAAEAAGGLYTRGTGAGQINQDANGRVDINVATWISTAVTLSTGNKPDVNVDEWADVLLATTNPLPNAVAGAANGIFIAGTNAATTVTTSFTTTFTGSLTGNVDGSVASVTADVGITAAAVDLIWDEAMVETTGAPAITGSMRLFMSWWAGLSRNKVTQTATTTTLRNDADAADLSTSTVSDDTTTFTRGEFSV